MLLVLHKGWLLCGELLQHSSHGCGAYAETMREVVAGHPLVFRMAQLQYGFQIVVD